MGSPGLKFRTACFGGSRRARITSRLLSCIFPAAFSRVTAVCISSLLNGSSGKAAWGPWARAGPEKVASVNQMQSAIRQSQSWAIPEHKGPHGISYPPKIGNRTMIYPDLTQRHLSRVTVKLLTGMSRTGPRRPEGGTLRGTAISGSPQRAPYVATTRLTSRGGTLRTC